jgi:pyrroline-5-carboxylate reductase
VLWISIAAGVPLAVLEAGLAVPARIVRAMPNTPALIGAGIAGMYAPDAVDAQSRDAAASVLAAAGEIVWVTDESMLDAVTGVSASGPAYVFYFLEALERAAKELGFDDADARKLAYATFDGAVKLARSSDADPATLRAQVTSKGGTTARGIGTLEQHGVAQAIVACVKAATARATELGDEFGRDA